MDAMERIKAAYQEAVDSTGVDLATTRVLAIVREQYESRGMWDDEAARHIGTLLKQTALP